MFTEVSLTLRTELKYLMDGERGNLTRSQLYSPDSPYYVTTQLPHILEPPKTSGFADTVSSAVTGTLACEWTF